MLYVILTGHFCNCLQSLFFINAWAFELELAKAKTGIRSLQIPTKVSLNSNSFLKFFYPTEKQFVKQASTVISLSICLTENLPVIWISKNLEDGRSTSVQEEKNLYTKFVVASKKHVTQHREKMMSTSHAKGCSFEHFRVINCFIISSFLMLSFFFLDTFPRSLSEFTCDPTKPAHCFIN